MRVWAIMIVAMLASACSSPRVLGPGPVEIGGFSMRLSGQWSQIPPESNPDILMDQLTRNGPHLNRVLFYRGLKDGESVLDLGFDQAPVFQDWMGDDQLDRFLGETLAEMGYLGTEIVQSDPGSVLGGEGCVYVLSMKRADGLIVYSIAMARYHAGELDLIVFLAPQEHYFQALAPELTDMFTTARRVD